MSKLSEVATRVNSFNLLLISGLSRLNDGRKEAAESIQNKLVKSFKEDEYVTPLVSVLDEIEKSATRLLIESTSTGEGDDSGPDKKIITKGPDVGDDQTKVLNSGNKDNLTKKEFLDVVEEIKNSFSENDTERVKITWEVYKK